MGCKTDLTNDKECQEYQFLLELLAFNKSLILENCSPHRVIAFDPSYIPKTGEKTESRTGNLLPIINQGTGTGYV